MRTESITFLVTFREVPGTLRVILEGDEARNGLEIPELACADVRLFICNYFGSDCVANVEIEEEV